MRFVLQTVNVTCNRDVSLQVVATGMNNRQIPLRNETIAYMLIYILMINLAKRGELSLSLKAKWFSIQVSSKLRTNGLCCSRVFFWLWRVDSNVTIIIKVEISW